MKNLKTNRTTAKIRAALFSAALLVSGLGSLHSEAATAFASPAGADSFTWDCVLSGNRNGTAYLTFFSDGTFIGYEVIVPNSPKTSDVDGRNGSGTGRSGETSSTTPSGTQIFGSQTPTGAWGFNAKGQTIGYFIETSMLENCVTSAVPLSTNTFPSAIPINTTNPPASESVFCVTTTIGTNDLGGGSFSYTAQEICYTNIIVCSALTNTISFTGKVTPNKRLTLTCSTPFGKTVYQGVPARDLSDLSGSWYGARKQAKTSFYEFLTLTPSTLPFPNIYDVVGTGPGYSYKGRAVLSAQKRISFYLGMDTALPTDPITVIRAVSGNFNPKKFQATTTGWNQPSGVFVNRISFSATKYQP